LKVLFVTRPISPPWNEGSKNFVFGLAKNLEKHEVHLLSSPGVSSRHSHITFEETFPRLRPSLTVPFSQKLRILLRLFKNDGSKILHFVFAPTAASSKLMRVPLFFKFPKPKTFQTVISTHAGPKELCKMVFADHVIALSKFMEKRLVGAGIKNVARIPPGIDLSEFRPQNSNAAKRRLGFGKRKVILFPGSLLEKLGALVLAEGAQEVIAKHPNALFVFACRNWGVPKEESKTKTKIRQLFKKHGLEKNLLFFGQVKSMPDLLAASDIIVFAPEVASVKFDYPLVVLEAMAMEKPVVVSNLEPLNEIFGENEGLKAVPGSPGSISKAVAFLLSNQEKAIEIGKNARKRAEREFDIKKSAKMLESLYEKAEAT